MRNAFTNDKRIQLTRERLSMYRLAIKRDFIARHFLIGGDWGSENQEHSHHYRIELRVQGEELDQHGYLTDIVVLEKALTAVIDRFQERTLNSLEPFRGLNPSLEHFARIVHRQVAEQLDLTGKHLTVTLWETENDWASFTPTP